MDNVGCIFQRGVDNFMMIALHGLNYTNTVAIIAVGVEIFHDKFFDDMHYNSVFKNMAFSVN